MKAIEEINKTKKETKMKNTLRPQEPRTVPLKDVIYVIIILASIIGSLIGGWTLRSNLADQAKTEAIDMVSSLSKTKQ